MSDDEIEDEDAEVEFTQSEQIILSTAESAAYIPCHVSMAEALGGEVLAYQLTAHGLYWLTPQRRWENVEMPIHKLKVTK